MAGTCFKFDVSMLDRQDRATCCHVSYFRLYMKMPSNFAIAMDLLWSPELDPQNLRKFADIGGMKALLRRLAAATVCTCLLLTVHRAAAKEAGKTAHEDGVVPVSDGRLVNLDGKVYLLVRESRQHDTEHNKLQCISPHHSHRESLLPISHTDNAIHQTASQLA